MTLNQPADIQQSYRELGLTPIFPVISATRLLALQERIYQEIKHLLVGHDSSLPILERLRLPFNGTPTEQDFSNFMRAMDNAREVKELVTSSEVQQAFCKVFGTDKVLPFPISRFRAQFPNLKRSSYNWHQDQGTWYAVPVKDLATKLPATLWLSINGAEENNSIELIAGSHQFKLQNHFKVEGQGYFNANLPKEVEHLSYRRVKTNPGEGIAFHPLTFHRSVVGAEARPRFSIDIRYFAESSTVEKYGVDWRFKAKRLLATLPFINQALNSFKGAQKRS